MKRTLTLIGVCGLAATVMTACQFDTTPDERRARIGMVDRDGQPLNTRTQYNLYDMYDVRDGDNYDRRRFGYVREQASPVKYSRRYNENIAAVNYDELANIITKTAVQMPNVEDVATLVTDEEVLIAYKTNSDDRKLVADQVSKTGLSIVPRYYHVYVSDNPRMIKEIENFRSLDVTSHNVDEILEDTIKEMLKSPQGKDLNKGENANGEGKGEVNEHIMKNEYGRQVKND